MGTFREVKEPIAGTNERFDRVLECWSRRGMLSSGLAGGQARARRLSEIMRLISVRKVLGAMGRNRPAARAFFTVVGTSHTGENGTEAY